MSVGNAVQASVFSKLDAALTYSVYDIPPQPDDSGAKTDWPYVTIGRDIVTPWDTNSEVGFSVTITVHVWSKKAGFKEAKTVQGEIYTALHRQSLSVTGYTFIACDIEQEQVIEDADGITIHGIQTFRIILDES